VPPVGNMLAPKALSRKKKAAKSRGGDSHECLCNCDRCKKREVGRDKNIRGEKKMIGRLMPSARDGGTEGRELHLLVGHRRGYA